MSEYIEREALIAAYDAAHKGPPGGARKLMEDAPAADVVEVKHGRWMMTLYTTTSKRRRVISNKKYASSECGYSNGRKQSPYCPNCGAKMDGGKDNG